MNQSRARTVRQRRRVLSIALVRVLATATAVVSLYYVLPLDHVTTPIGIALAIGVLLLVVFAILEISAVLRARHPAVRAVEALAAYVPIYLVLFSSGYYLMASADPANFNVDSLTRTDTLYFTFTIFSTVGFGDITAASQVARAVVMVQMMLNLILFGLGIRLLTQAVHIGVARQHAEHPSGTDSSPAATD